MKRKIIRQGHSTLTITLPSKWAKKFNLKQGDELELFEKNDGLLLAAERQSEKLRTEIDITSLDLPMIWKYFMAIYREGYDEVKVVFPLNKHYENPYKFLVQHSLGERVKQLNSFELLNNMIHRFIGWEIIEHKDNFCVIKDLTEISSKEFDSSLRRVFLLIKQMGEELVSAIETKNNSILEHTHDLDINTDKFHDYCIRVLNKTGFKSSKKTSLLFSTLYLLELLGDEFKSISHYVLKEHKNLNLLKISHFTKRVIEQFNNFYDLFYVFETGKVVAMSKIDTEIYNYPFCIDKKFLLNSREVEIANHLKRIMRYVNALLELRIEMEY